MDSLGYLVRCVTSMKSRRTSRRVWRRSSFAKIGFPMRLCTISLLLNLSLFSHLLV